MIEDKKDNNTQANANQEAQKARKDHANELKWQARKEAWSRGSKVVATNIITWQWTRQLVSWIIISAGTAADFGFLFGGLWMSLNAGLHDVFVNMLGANLDKNIASGVAMMYIGLPELIACLAVVTVYNHVKTFMATREKAIWIWILLFGLPTIVFVLLSFIVIYNSVIAADSNSTFILDKSWIGIRGISGFLFAFTSMVYVSIGKKQEADRIIKRDTIIANLKQEMNETISLLIETSSKISRQYEEEYVRNTTALQAENAEYKRIIEGQKNEIAVRKAEKERLENELKADSEMALQAYSQEFKDLLFSGIKTILVEDVCRYTGFNRNKITNAIKNRNLETATRNKELVTVNSLVEWLKNVQPNTSHPAIHIVNG